MKKDIIIIGGGVVGCAVARLLSRYEADVALLEGASDVAEGASKANSGIVHAGFDAKPGTLKAKLNVEGARMYPALCAEVDAPYGQPGAMVLAFTEEERANIRTLYEQGVANGVEGLRVIEREEVLSLEPNVNPDVVCALLAPTSGITSPYELTCALADHAAVNGVDFLLDTFVQSVRPGGAGYLLETTRGPMEARIVINCAGVDSARLHNQLCPQKPLTIIPRKGEYYLLDHTKPLAFSMTLFQTPTKMGKGVLVSPTVHGNLLLGPSAIDVEDGTAVETTAEALKLVADAARKTWPGESLRGVITTFAGIRAHETNGDFVIGAVEGAPGAYETVGIESPGLTSAPAIAEMLVEQIARGKQPFGKGGMEARAQAREALLRHDAGGARGHRAKGPQLRHAGVPLRGGHRGRDPRGDPPPGGRADHRRGQAPHPCGHGPLPGWLLQPARSGDSLRGTGHRPDRGHQVRRGKPPAGRHHRRSGTKGGRLIC